MTTAIIALVSLCFVVIAHAVPIDVVIPQPVPEIPEPELADSGSEAQMRGGGFEGDMVFPKGFNPKNSARGVAIYGNRQWPSNTIPYDLSAITDATDKAKITEAMNTLMFAVGTPIANSNQRQACVYFRPRQAADQIYLRVVYGNGCSANVGYLTQQLPVMTLEKNQGPQQIGCFHTQVIQHELLHVLGYFHEQSRPDRDTFLQINLGNVEASMKHNFDKYAWGSTVTNQGSTYDYASIMHYGTTAFSMNGQPTMVPRQSGVTIGEAKQLSPMDIAEVRHFYRCDA